MEKIEENRIAARGGPIYVPNLVGPLTRVLDFESALLRELHDLKDELVFDTTNQIDISVDEIKLVTDEDLVEMALQDDSPSNDEDPSNTRENNNTQHLESSANGNVVKNDSNKSRKRKLSSKSSNARSRAKNVIDESCLSKVSELLKIKENQIQDKAACRLHSLNFKIPSIEKTESVKYLKSAYYENQYSKPQNVQEHVALQQQPEFILRVEVYHNIRKWVKTQEFLVLGSQLLTEMRDKIYCMSDQVMQHDPSGYFLVENVFYNDLRDSSAINYSEPILDWLRNSKDEAFRKWECIITSGELRKNQKIADLGELPLPTLPQFRCVDMQKTRFCDLRFRLGAGYLYCHQGDCKHTIVIRDMRLIHPEDLQNQAAYPVVIFQFKPRVQKCSVCGIFRAKKVTVDDKWSPHNPCYFCNDCYYLLHYNENGSLLYSDFSTYDYVHDLPN